MIPRLVPSKRRKSKRETTPSARKVGPQSVEAASQAKANALDGLWRRFTRRRRSDVRNLLVERYQSFLSEVVRRFAVRLPPNVDDGDLFTAANFGLIAAIEAFEPSRGVPFESYCELRVRGALLDELRTQDWLPRPWRARIERHKRAVELLRAQLEREPDDTEIAAALEMTYDEYSSVFNTGSFTAPSSTTSHTNGGERGAALLDIVPDRDADLPIERLTREEMLGLVTDSLSPQECRIVYLKYWEDLPLREIGEIEGLSESRVCKIHLNLLERLQARFLASDRA